VPASWGEASIRDTQELGGRPRTFFVTSVQVAPSSRVTWMLPSSVPAQITPRCTGDSAIVRIVEWNSAAVLST
jgi:hypothetical protein